MAVVTLATELGTVRQDLAQAGGDAPAWVRALRPRIVVEEGGIRLLDLAPHGRPRLAAMRPPLVVWLALAAALSLMLLGALITRAIDRR